MFEYFSSVDESSSIPTQTVFSQQRIDAWRPLFTPFIVIIICFSIGTIFIIFGAIFYGISTKQVEIDVRYDDVCGSKQNCSVNITIDNDIKSVVFLSYKLTNFFQNHQRYISSRSYDQLRGEYVDYKGMKECGNFRSLDDTDNKTKWILPCGAVAYSFFNDTYKWDSDKINEKFSESGISWRSDRKKIFKNLSSEYDEGFKWLSNTFAHDQGNEHFIVWMRAAALPTFIKPYMKSSSISLPKGTYSININNSYPTSIFHGEKHIVLNTISGIGSKNNPLGLSYLIVGAIIDICGILIAISNIFFPRKLGDANYLLSSYIDEY